MDYYIDLANDEDAYEAIVYDRRIRRSHEAEELLFYEFLREQHPTAWITEVVHAFYAKLDFAARVWKNLRYCAASRRRLGAYIVDNRFWWQLRSKAARLGVSLPESRKKYVDAAAKNAERYAEELSEAEIDLLCEIPENLPSAPGFLGALMDACAVPDSERDARTQALLADRAEVDRFAKKAGIAVPFAMVLDHELDQICATRDAVHRVEQTGRSGAGRAPLRRALDMNLLGLAFSGGGIRSATFNLGVLQALSKIGLLRQVDYCSTVSGGGYIGSWLAAWIRRESRTTADCSGTMVDIQRRLSPIRSPNPIDERVRPIRFLREYSNYLTPRTGFLSADTWTMIGIYLRNTLLNQVIIVSLVAAALLTPRLVFKVLTVVPPGTWQPIPLRIRAINWIIAVPWTVWVLAIAGGAVLVFNLGRLHPRRLATTGHPTPPPPPSPFATLKAIQCGVAFPWTAAAALTAWYINHPVNSTAGLAERAGHIALLGGVVVSVAFFVMLTWGQVYRSWEEPPGSGVAPEPWYVRLAANRSARIRTAGGWIKERVAALDRWLQGKPVVAEALAKTNATGQGMGAVVLAAAVCGVVAAALIWVLVRTIAIAPDADARNWHALTLGTAGLLAVVSLSIVAMLGMLGEQFPDEHREWWSRLRTSLHMWAIGWLLAFAAAVYVPWAYWWMGGWRDRIGFTAMAGWIGSTIFGVLRGRSAEEGKSAQPSDAARVPATTSALRFAAQVAPFVFIVGLLCACSIAIDRVYLHNAPAERNFGLVEEYWSFVTWSSSGEPAPFMSGFGSRFPHVWTTLAWLGLAAIGLLFSWRVDINDFSIHHFYKNRLVRCYLGASHSKERQPDWFTGFDPDDDVPLTAFDHGIESKAPYPGPYPIVNCALNLVAGEDLAWQERKSASFVFTPKYCGYDVDRAVLTKKHDGLRTDAYVPTCNYYHAGEGPRLGMAMAISGAAANPNMGRASTPALAFLMTVFNVRLGWWVANPRKGDGVRRASPWIGLPYTVLELFGGTDDRRDYVNLSDGGHFENLGVYELVRRGCRYIILCDAGQDDKFTCEDLGNLVRICRTDFGVEIDISIDRIRELSTAGRSQAHCVVGTIHYLAIPKRSDSNLPVNEDGGPLLRGSRPAHEVGYLIYLKPSLTGDEPQDVLEYARRVSRFPHQTTADQWFDESQFESYRKLGMHIAEDAFCRYQDDDTKPLANMAQLFERLHGYWYPPSLVINQGSTELVNEYTRIMDIIRTNRKLASLDHTMFERMKELPKPADPREAFYVCNALIQLMENVYADLDLEHLWRHPHVQGWMAVFERWAQQPAFRSAWRTSEPTYSARFRNFYNDRLRGRVIALPRGFVASNGADGQPAYQGDTIECLMAVVRRGANVVHLDVRKLQTGELVVWPSDSVDGNQLNALALDDFKRAAPGGATFTDCADRLHGLVQLCIGLMAKDIASEVVKTLRDRPGEGPNKPVWRRRDFVLVGRCRPTLTNDPDNAPVRTGLVVDEKTIDEAIDHFLEVRTDFLAPEAACLKKGKRLERIVAERIPLVPWLVDDAADLGTWMKHESVAGVVTNNVEGALDVKRWL